MAKVLNHKDFHFSHSIHYKPALHLDETSSQDGLYFTNIQSRNQYAGIVIRNYDYALMADEISDKVFEKNQMHNLKSSQEILLIDKQGILYVTSSESINSKKKIKKQFPELTI
jgi:hypothetical protein